MKASAGHLAWWQVALCFVGFILLILSVGCLAYAFGRIVGAVLSLAFDPPSNHESRLRALEERQK